MERLLEDRHRKFRLIAASVSSLETAMDPGQTGHESEASLAPTDRAGEADLSAQPVFPKVPPESVD